MSISIVETAKNWGDFNRTSMLAHEGAAYSEKEPGYSNS